MFLFGSRASGKARERSDIDIGIEGPAPVPRAALAAINDELEEAPPLYTVEVVDFARHGDFPARRATADSIVTKRKSLRADFERATTRLAEALALPKDAIVRDSAIQRFEISFELCWKFVKAYLEEEYNVSCTSPRTCFRAAFKNGVIADDPFWIDLTVLRNYTVHTDNEQLANHVYDQRPEAVRRFRALLNATC